jgi:DNA-directed RNA polymerase subunit K/omega
MSDNEHEPGNNFGDELEQGYGNDVVGVEETKGGESEELELEEDVEEEDVVDVVDVEEDDVEEDDAAEDDAEIELQYQEQVDDDIGEEPDGEDGTTVGAPQTNDINNQPYDESSGSDTSESESDSEDEYVSKVDLEKKLQYIKETHTQEISKTYEEMIAMTKIKRQKKTDGEDIIDDETHTTVPILTKYEKTRVLGLRVSQLNEGAPRYISINETIIDNNIIAEKELRLKKLPFIVSRPLPNGEKEHWRLKDLEIL